MIEKTNNIKGLFEQKLNESKALADIEQLRIIQQEIYVLGSEICTIENYVNVIIDEMERFSDSQHTQNKINRTEKNITDVNARLNKLDLKSLDQSELIGAIRKVSTNFFFKKTKRKPVVLSIVVRVD